MKIVNNLPTWILGIFIQNLAEMASKRLWWVRRVRQIRTSPNPNEIKSTIFEGILSSSSLPPEEKTDARMAADAQLVGLAGEGTTEMGMVLATIINRYDVYKGQEGRTLELYDTVRERDIVANSEK
ncbi:cytochrome P450 [Apiospora sp. TS-2023a]